MSGSTPGQSVVVEEADDRALGSIPWNVVATTPPCSSSAPGSCGISSIPIYLLIRIDEQLDSAKLVEPLEECYCPDFGQACHPSRGDGDRALLICSLYNIASFRRLCSALSEYLAYRWFCFLTIDDPAFDHSSISHFIDRIGRDGFAATLDGLNDEPLRVGDVGVGDVRGRQSGRPER